MVAPGQALRQTGRANDGSLAIQRLARCGNHRAALGHVSAASSIASSASAFKGWGPHSGGPECPCPEALRDRGPATSALKTQGSR
jgi:hypothetical protein